MGDGSFERFCAQAYPRLVGALTHQVGDRWVAEEIAQEALVRAGARWDRVAALASPIGWTFHVGANLARSHIRRRLAEQRAMRRHGPPNTSQIGGDGQTVDRLMLDAALRQLSDAQRRAVVLRFYLGLSADEAADALGSTPGAVRALTHRGIAQLRQLLATNDTPREAWRGQ